MLLIFRMMNQSKPRMKSRFNKYLLSFCLILICTMVSAQDVPVPGTKDVVPNPGLPIDGGLGYLIISGLIYGALKLRNKK